MEVRYALTPEDYVSYFQHLQRRRACVVHNAISFVIVGALLCLAAFGLARDGFPFPSLRRLANMALWIVGTMLAFVLIAVIVLAAFALGRRLMPCPRPFPECTVRLTSSGVGRADGQGEVVWKWTAVEQISEGRRRFFVCMAPARCVTASRVVVVPKRAFADEQHAAAFLAEARRLRREAGAGTGQSSA